MSIPRYPSAPHLFMNSSQVTPEDPSLPNGRFCALPQSKSMSNLGEMLPQGFIKDSEESDMANREIAVSMSNINSHEQESSLKIYENKPELTPISYVEAVFKSAEKLLDGFRGYCPLTSQGEMAKVKILAQFFEETSKDAEIFTREKLNSLIDGIAKGLKTYDDNKHLTNLYFSDDVKRLESLSFKDHAWSLLQDSEKSFLELFENNNFPRKGEIKKLSAENLHKYFSKISEEKIKGALLERRQDLQKPFASLSPDTSPYQPLKNALKRELTNVFSEEYVDATRCFFKVGDTNAVVIAWNLYTKISDFFHSQGSDQKNLETMVSIIDLMNSNLRNYKNPPRNVEDFKNSLKKQHPIADENLTEKIIKEVENFYKIVQNSSNPFPIINCMRFTCYCSKLLNCEAFSSGDLKDIFSFVRGFLELNTIKENEEFKKIIQGSEQFSGYGYSEETIEKQLKKIIAKNDEHPFFKPFEKTINLLKNKKIWNLVKDDLIGVIVTLHILSSKIKEGIYTPIEKEIYTEKLEFIQKKTLQDARPSPLREAKDTKKENSFLHSILYGFQWPFKAIYRLFSFLFSFLHNRDKENLRIPNDGNPVL